MSRTRLFPWGDRTVVIGQISVGIMGQARLPLNAVISLAALTVLPLSDWASQSQSLAFVHHLPDQIDCQIHSYGSVYVTQ
jgi:hypothetical protein